MMYPILCKVQYEVLHRTFSDRGVWKQIGFSVFVNWIVAPFLMVCTPAVLSTVSLSLVTDTSIISWDLLGRSYPTRVSSALV